LKRALAIETHGVEKLLSLKNFAHVRKSVRPFFLALDQEE
jgi:hypothetical protein